MEDVTQKAARTPLMALVLLAFLVLAVPAAAQPLGSQQQLSFTEPLEDLNFGSTHSAVTYGGGRSLVVWQQELEEPRIRNRGSDAATVIMGRFVNGAAAPLAAPFVIGDADATKASARRCPTSRTTPRAISSSPCGNATNAQPAATARATIRGALVARTAASRSSENLTPEGQGMGDPAAAYSPASDAFLVAYDDETDAVYAQKVGAADLALIGEPQDLTAGESLNQLPGFVVSPPSPMPDVAFDAASGRWLVVFQASKPTQSRSTIEVEIFGRSIDANLQASALQRLSHAEEGGLDPFVATREPAVAADGAGGGFLIVYVGTPTEEAAGPGHRGRRGDLLAPRQRRRHAGGDAHQVSDDRAEDATLEHPARRPDVWHDPNADQFLATWAQDISESRAGAGRRRAASTRCSARSSTAAACRRVPTRASRTIARTTATSSTVTCRR